ncbi:hypothetical protein [Pseudoalteromonas sp. TB64]|uniref:hypothetical protein n=1 Tax=Pseudoalteromonas sp. TB64 TaxID=1938600 RepID=UPI0004644727|nr:hypothetical protein [Pseudoalteromonas sp. TB64]
MKTTNIKLIKVIVCSLSLLSLSSYAECIVSEHATFPQEQGSINYWQQLIRNSDDDALAIFWDQGNCSISKGPHDGGKAPDKRNGSTLHITIEDGFRTCHVFNQKNSELRTLTTCNP